MIELNKDHLAIIVKNLRSRKLRSYLTILGIVIGITAIISLIMLGQALQDGITKQFDKFGTRRIFVGPKFASGLSGLPTGSHGLIPDDVKTIERLPITDYVADAYFTGAKINYGREEKYMDVGGVNINNFEKSYKDLDITILKGRFFAGNEKRSVLIGYKAANDLFEKEIRVGNSIKIDDVKFKVIGILQEEGNRDIDYAIRVPIDTFREIKNKPDAITAITAMIKPGVDMDYAEKRVFDALEKRRNDENFQVTNPQKLKRQTGSIIGVVKWVFIAIACISLIVGAIGIMNSMYTSVLERTRDIGVMKAIGARNSTILSMFLIESGFLGLIGGIIGIIMGLAFAYGMVSAANTLGFFSIELNISYKLIIFGVCFAFFLGIGSGTLPAYRAARLKPVDALRYE